MISFFSEGIEGNPTGDALYFGRGIAWGEKGEYDKAIADFSEAITLNSDQKCLASYFKYRSLMYEKKGEFEKALSDLRRFWELLQIDPSNLEDIARLEEEIRRQRLAER